MVWAILSDAIILAGGFSALLTGMIALFLGVGSGRMPGALTSKPLREGLKQDYHDKKIFLGGPLGLMKYMVKFSIGCLAIGALLRFILIGIGQID